MNEGCLQCDTALNQRKDRVVKYCSHKCYALHMTGPYIVKKGYKRVLKKDHPRADSKGYVREHILVMEEKIGRYVGVGEVVHHKDENKLNNHPDNLELLPNNAEHMKLHRKRR